jgi:MscS family membrane protein
VIPKRSALTIAAALVFALLPGAARAQTAPGGAATTAATPEAAKDTLGRDTPRGTLLGFIRAARDGSGEVASLYLNTSLRGSAAQDLARELYVVLDSRLPARLIEVSDKPEGSQANPLRADQEVIGTVASAAGPLEVVVERVNRGSAGRVWLFSRRTLDAIPGVYHEIDLVRIDRFVPEILTKARVGGVRLFAWIAAAVLIPLLYRLLGGIAVALAWLTAMWRRRRPAPDRPAAPLQPIPGFVRLLLMAVAARWVVGRVDLPLAERQFWSIVGAIQFIIALVWGLLRLNAVGERRLRRRFMASGHAETTAVLRLVRRAGDAVVIAVGVLLTLRYFGVDPTAALAGLGIGGIAVALAAQKTLENVIGGLSIIFDNAVRVGDSLKVGDTVGMVDSIGLRSTRIRTLDRTMISVPNGQIANANIETLSARDKYWFHHVIPLRLETTASQLGAVLDNLRTYLASHPMTDRTDTIRVRFIRLGAFSLDVEIFAYIVAAGWDPFLETQQELLLETMLIVERAGAAIALPSQAVQFAHAAGPDAAPVALSAIAAASVAGPHTIAGGAR